MIVIAMKTHKKVLEKFQLNPIQLNLIQLNLIQLNLIQAIKLPYKSNSINTIRQCLLLNGIGWTNLFFNSSKFNNFAISEKALIKYVHLLKREEEEKRTEKGIENSLNKFKPYNNHTYRYSNPQMFRSFNYDTDDPMKILNPSDSEEDEGDDSDSDESESDSDNNSQRSYKKDSD